MQLSGIGLFTSNPDKAEASTELYRRYWVIERSTRDGSIKFERIQKDLS